MADSEEGVLCGRTTFLTLISAQIEWVQVAERYYIWDDLTSVENATQSDLDRYEVVGTDWDALNAELEEIAVEDEIDSMANKCHWHDIDFELPNHASGGNTKRRMTERVWMNYLPPEVLTHRTPAPTHRSPPAALPCHAAIAQVPGHAACAH